MESQGTSVSSVAAFQIRTTDNVATLLGDAAAEARVVVRGEQQLPQITAREPIQEGHKMALVRIEPGDQIMKYGTSIGTATQAIEPGEWVHLHNCRSNYDARSSTLDVTTGASTDVRYE